MTSSGNRPTVEPSSLGSGLRALVAFVALLWGIEVVDALVPANLDINGVRPRDVGGLEGVLFGPLLHAGWGHLIANTVPLLGLGLVMLLTTGLRRLVVATAVIWLVGGLGQWLLGAPGTVHVGASGIVFGWLAYLLVIGFLNRRAGQIAVAVVLFVLYGSALWGIFPGQAGISWQGHLFGAVGGVLAARWLRDRAR